MMIDLTTSTTCTSTRGMYVPGPLNTVASTVVSARARARRRRRRRSRHALHSSPATRFALPSLKSRIARRRSAQSAATTCSGLPTRVVGAPGGGGGGGGGGVGGVHNASFRQRLARIERERLLREANLRRRARHERAAGARQRRTSSSPCLRRTWPLGSFTTLLSAPRTAGFCAAAAAHASRRRAARWRHAGAAATRLDDAVVARRNHDHCRLRRDARRAGRWSRAAPTTRS